MSWKDLASTGGIVFVNEIEALRSEARRLKGAGADIIIAVGHSGFGEDKEIAREVDGLDVVVGGHTNTLLWNGENPLGEIPAGPYPVQVRQPRNRVTESMSFSSQCGKVNDLNSPRKGIYAKVFS